MRVVRGLLTFVVLASLLFPVIPILAGSNAPLGVLTLTIGAHLNQATAFPGLAFFEGEMLSTENEGKLSARVGGSQFTLGSSSKVTLHRIQQGAHADLDAGSVYFSTEENVEVHALGAFVRPANNMPTQADVTIWKPRVLQITAKRGDLAFTYQQEFQVLPEGETYRIYLGEDTSSQEAMGAGASGRGLGGKLTYFIVGGAAGGVAAWGVTDMIKSHEGMESPAKP